MEPTKDLCPGVSVGGELVGGVAARPGEHRVRDNVVEQRAIEHVDAAVKGKGRNNMRVTSDRGKDKTTPGVNMCGLIHKRPGQLKNVPSDPIKKSQHKYTHISHSKLTWSP